MRCRGSLKTPPTRIKCIIFFLQTSIRCVLFYTEASQTVVKIEKKLTTPKKLTKNRQEKKSGKIHVNLPSVAKLQITLIVDFSALRASNFVNKTF